MGGLQSVLLSGAEVWVDVLGKEVYSAETRSFVFLARKRKTIYRDRTQEK